ncbi:MAG: hypothetical protein WA960_02480 [Tunicatimonas sp.]
MTRSLTVVLLLLLAYASGYGQASSFLMFEKSRNRRAFYYPGDEISLQLRGDRSKFTGRIQELQDSVILFEHYRVRVSDITHIYQDDKQNWYTLRHKISPMLLIGGTGYLVLDVVNSREFDRGTLVLSGAMIGAGLLAKWLIPTKTRIRGRRRLKIVGL